MYLANLKRNFLFLSLPWHCGLCGSSHFESSQYQKRNCDTTDLTRKTTGISNIPNLTLPQAIIWKKFASNRNKNMRNNFTRNINKHTKDMCCLESSVSDVDLYGFYGKNVSAAPRQPSRLCNMSWPQNLTCASFCIWYTTNILWSGKF